MGAILNMTHFEKIARSLSLRPNQVSATVKLIDEGNTLPFIARYRKEMTGSLDEEQLRDIHSQVNTLRALDDRRETIVAAITEQGKLTDELHQRLLAAETMTALEDLYAPYKKKRRTRASMAREKGLEPLAEFILLQMRSRQTAAQIANPFLNDEVPTVDDAYAGACDIVAETISDDADVRSDVREKALKWAQVQTSKIKKAVDERNTYELYYEFTNRIDRLRPHQIL